MLNISIKKDLLKYILFFINNTKETPSEVLNKLNNSSM